MQKVIYKLSSMSERSSTSKHCPLTVDIGREVEPIKTLSFLQPLEQLISDNIFGASPAPEIAAAFFCGFGSGINSTSTMAIVTTLKKDEREKNEKRKKPNVFRTVKLDSI